MIAILGATGNVGRKIADILIKKGEKVRLIARSGDKLRPLVGKRSEAMAGDAVDTEFLVQAFKDADAVFTLIPPNKMTGNYLEFSDRIGSSIARALEIARISHVVNLSSVGAELSSGTGPVVGLHHQEERLNRIPGLNVLHLRAACFMENLLMNTDRIRSKGVNADVITGNLQIPMIATRDIASFAAERLSKRDFTGSSVQYLLGKHDLSMNEATVTIGIKIGKPNLRYATLSYEDAERGLMAAGFSKDVSRLYSEMNKAFNDGRIAVKRSAENTTQTSFAEFCDEVFVPRYMEKKAA